MYKVWLIKSGWFASGSYSTLTEAIDAVKEIPENCSIQKYEGGRFVDVGSWYYKNKEFVNSGGTNDES